MISGKPKTAIYDLEIVPIGSIKPSPENDDIYNGVDLNRADFQATLKSIKKDGIREPLQVTKDGFILSGHRRYRCAKELKLRKVPVIRLPINRSDLSKAEYRQLLTEYNTQRDKTAGERMRELAARSEPKRFRTIMADRMADSPVTVGNVIDTCGEITRHAIGANAQEFLNAVIEIVTREKPNWPVSVRSVHYKLLDVQPLTNTSKGKHRHRYANDEKSSSKLSDLLTRARIFGLLPMDCIADETRSEANWDVHDSVVEYADKLSRNFARLYSRNLMIDQPHHVEIIVEKNTVKTMAEGVASEYSIPVTTARGKCSLPPRAHVVDCWRWSGKDKLILILMADHDPDGIVISDMWHKSLVGDFGIDPDDLIAIRAGLNKDQVKRFNLPRSISAKPSSPTYKSFVKKYGTDAFELDALKSDDFKTILKEAIESVIDRDAYDVQVSLYEQEAGFLDVASTEFAGFMSEIMDEFEG